MMNFRAARASDLASIYLVYYLSEVGEAEGVDTAPPLTIPSVLRHVFETGTMYVAEQGQLHEVRSHFLPTCSSIPRPSRAGWERPCSRMSFPRIKVFAAR